MAEYREIDINASRMPRFYCNQPLEIGQRVALPEAVAHHVQVLRLREGGIVTLFNGQGGEYSAVLAELERRRVSVEIKAFSPREAEPGHAIALAQALPEGAKMDWIVEKAVELGATAIQPLVAQRSVVRVDQERAAKKAAHWQAVIVAAAEQSGRNRLPTLSPVLPFGGWIAQQDMHKRLLLSPRASSSLADWAKHHPAQAVSLVVGPEGGLTDDEEQAAIRQGAICLAMGPRVLRTETAGLAAIATLQALWGGF